ncbi:hypothetical protein DEU56DRAFT_836338 [Suillus clintonianus]|uniref:uncharacterized protein n=1 Tax=Suillus clintonianus TaxID=1904413 RepID=UPI001B874BD4|nr:uncharacterized protein DEU56DRAFT_836338 [Suillus clintonianus]KAG2119404.1 hypothetical protein DEU56DRAFT_836338 [Suillus clintonianus]
MSCSPLVWLLSVYFLMSREALTAKFLCVSFPAFDQPRDNFSRVQIMWVYVSVRLWNLGCSRIFRKVVMCACRIRLAGRILGEHRSSGLRIYVCCMNHREAGPTHDLPAHIAPFCCGLIRLSLYN